MKTLRKYMGTYRIIAYYAYDTKNKKYYFLSSKDGIGEEDYCIPLKLTPKLNDWFAMSNLSVDGDSLYIYIPSLKKGYKVLNDLKKTCGVLSYESSSEEYIIHIPIDALDNPEVVKILQPMTRGKKLGPKDKRNLPKIN
jgi:hypothetical protein